MLVGSIGARGSAPADRVIAEHAQADLTQWLRHVSQDGRLTGEQDLPIALEIALAQGLKYAANRRPGQPDVLRESRMFLAEQALEMLKSARYWFTQLTLIHALTLLNLSETKQPWDKYGAKPEAIVQHWLDVAGRERLRPQPAHRGPRHDAASRSSARRRCSASWRSRPSGRSGICGSTRAGSSVRSAPGTSAR